MHVPLQQQLRRRHSADPEADKELHRVCLTPAAFVLQSDFAETTCTAWSVDSSSQHEHTELHRGAGM